MSKITTFEFEALNLENHLVEIVLELDLVVPVLQVGLAFVVEFVACNSKSDQ